VPTRPPKAIEPGSESRLPEAPRPASRRGTPPPEATPSALDRAPRVLVIEDNEALAENVAELFDELGAETEVCGTAAEGLDQARRGSFDLAVVDVRLPEGVQGVDLVPELKAVSPDGEVIVVTGSATLDTAIAAVREGVFAYVQKPFDPDDLLALGERALSQVRLRHERAALARELARSEALYRGVVETVDALIVGIDQDGAISFANPAAAERARMGTTELLGRSYAEVFAPRRDASRVRRALEDAKAGRATDALELQVPPPASSNGRGRSAAVVIWTLTPLRTGPTRTPAVALAAGTDVTLRRALERRAAESEAMAAMGRLTTGLTHEIRNPLNAAKLQLELLSRRARRLDPSGQVLDGPVRVVKDELGRLSRLAEEFLSLARPRQLSPGEVPLRELFDEIIALQRPVIDEDEVVVDVRCDPGVSCTADRERLKQALLNLVVNAVEAMRGRPDRRLTLSAGDTGSDRFEIRVEDTGPGLSPDLVEDVFDPFVTTKEAGTGLGLPIVRRIVEQHGGSIVVEPADGGGARARMVLPR